MAMQHKIFSITFALGVLVPLAAPADVTVYGRAQVEIGFVKDASERSDGLSGDGSKVDGTNMVDAAQGRIGVKAAEDLSDALLTFAVMEFKVDTADGDAGGKCSTQSDGAAGSEHTHDCDSSGVALTPRETNLGIQGRFGTVEFGRIKSPYKYTGGVRYDPFVATTLEARGNGGMSPGSFGHSGFLIDSIGYRSASVGGLIVWFTYNPETEANSSKCPKCATNGDALSYAVSYGTKDWEAFYAGNNDSDDEGLGEKSYRAAKYGGMIDVDGHKFKIQYETIDNKGVDDTYSFLGYEGRNQNNLWVIQLGKFEPGTPSGLAKPKSLDYASLGMIHRASKETRIIAGYRRTTEQESVFSLGMRKDF